MPMLDEIGLAHQLNRSGALFVYESEIGYRRDADEWNCRRANGVEIQKISGSDARQLEPDLGPRVQCAVLTPQWSYLSDPKDLMRGLRVWLLDQGASITTSEVVAIEKGTAAGLSVTVESGRVAADVVVVAAGAWSGLLARRLGDRVSLESERGYNMTLPAPGIVLKHELIFAERKFVATPLASGLRIGGAAEFAGLDAPANFRRSEALLALAQLYLPGLRSEGAAAWMGQRPATPDSLPIIGRSPRRRNILYACGHGHLGLTQAATTGRLIADLVGERTPPIDMAPYSIARF
jgi:D-amino-acid dehydrogenase